jgi:diguanylate cyclase (GGDEF)-like protein/PAS domain S-box-containing protein
MSIMFHSPLTPSTEGGMRDLLRIGPENDPFWANVRRSQMRFMLHYLPFNLAVALTNGAVVLAAFADRIDPMVLLMWATLSTAIISIWIYRFSAARLRGRKFPATPRFIRILALEMAAVGLAWGLMFMSVLPVLPASLAMLVVAMTMAMVGCSAFSAAIFPLGAVALSGPIILGTLFGILMTDWPEADLVGIVVASFILIIIRSNILSTLSFLSRRRARDRLIEQEQMIRLLLNEFEANGRDWLFEFDAGGTLTFASARFADAAGRPVDQLIGLSWTRFLDDITTAAPLMAFVRKGRPFRDHLLRVEINGEPRWWSLSGTPKRDGSGRLTGYRGVGSDVTDRQASAQRIADLATFDTLTGLVNRRVIHATLEKGLAQPNGVTLLFVDLDRFKSVNDSLGHAAGDRLLAEVATRLRAVVGTHGLVGRLGGDEFAVVLHGSDAEQATLVGGAIVERLSQPYRLGTQQAVIGASIGFAIGPRDGATVEALMRSADLALYDVKGKGRGSIRCYDRELHRLAEERRALELDLRNALAKSQLRLVFQPVVNAYDQRIVGFEALMRWRHPVHGDVPPGVFIPIAEESGMIGAMGEWALSEACRIAMNWPQDIKISVNLSPLQFDDPDFAQTVERVLNRWKMSPSRLELELTESLFLDERPQTTSILNRLRQMGVAFALDDFGTGYASLGYLQKINFSRIKIDRSFVRSATADGGESVAIIQAIIALAEQLGMATTAEGTETLAEFEAMRRLGCAQIQGYYFGRPMPPENVLRLLDRKRPMVTLELAPEEATPALPAPGLHSAEPAQ